jgi:hypothetical protein
MNGYVEWAERRRWFGIFQLQIITRMVNSYSRKFRTSSCNIGPRDLLSFGKRQAMEEHMRKLTCALAAAATLAIAAPTLANAGGFGVYVGGDHDRYGDRYDGPRARFYGHDRGWHRGWYHHDRDYYGDRGVVIRRHYWDD